MMSYREIRSLTMSLLARLVDGSFLDPKRGVKDWDIDCENLRRVRPDVASRLRLITLLKSDADGGTLEWTEGKGLTLTPEFHAAVRALVGDPPDIPGTADRLLGFAATEHGAASLRTPAADRGAPTPCPTCGRAISHSNLPRHIREMHGGGTAQKDPGGMDG